MTTTDKFKWIILPALLLIGLGILEFKFPHAMHGFHGTHTARNVSSAVIVFLFEIILVLTWSKIGGVITIFGGLSAIAFCCWPRNANLSQANQAESNTNN